MAFISCMSKSDPMNVRLISIEDKIFYGGPYESDRRVSAESRVEQTIAEMKKQGWRLVSSSTSGSRGFFINDFAINLIFER